MQVIYGANGRPVGNNVGGPDYDLSFKPVQELGVSGLNRTGGYIYEEILPELRDEKGRRALRLMIDHDPIVGGILLMIESLARQVEFRVDPASQDNEDLQNADFIRGCLFDDMSMTFQDTLSEIITFIPWGWEYSEIVYKKRAGPTPGILQGQPLPESVFDDGKIGIRKIAPRAQETLYQWQFDDTGGVQAMVQLAPPVFRPVAIPIEKSLLFRTTARKGNPEGRSVLRNAYEPWFYKRNIQKIEAIGVERDLAGYPVAYVPSAYLGGNADQFQKSMVEALKKIITGIRRDSDEGAIMPMEYDKDGNPLFKLELMQSGGRREFATGDIIQRHDLRIAMSVMADFILLGSQSVGSFALASSKTNIFSIALGTFLDIICDVINRHLVKRLLALNGIPAAKRPKLMHGDIEDVPLEEIAAFITAMANAGAPFFPSPDGALENWALKRIGAPAVDPTQLDQVAQPVLPQNEAPQDANPGDEVVV